MLLLLSGAPLRAYDPCPVCRGRVTDLDKVKDDRSKEPRNAEFFNRSICGMMDMLNAGSVICTRCWMGNRWDEQTWVRRSSQPSSFIPPMEKALREFPVPPEEGGFERQFDGQSVTDSIEMEWNEARFPGFREYCKKNNLVIELRGRTAKHYFGESIVVTDTPQPKPAEMGFTESVSIIVKAPPKELYAKPLPPKRPVELKTAKASYERERESLREQYIDRLLEMLKRADRRGKDGKTYTDFLAEKNVMRELRSMVLPENSDAKELAALLIGKWKSKKGYAPIWRSEKVWGVGLTAGRDPVGSWRVERNKLMITGEKLRENDEEVTNSYLIILVNKKRLVCLWEWDPDGEVRYDIESWERIPEVRRR